MKPEKITLYFKEGTSDKVYQAQLIAEQDHLNNKTIWKVVAAYGRRGGTMNHIDKTGGTQEYRYAKRDYDKLVHSKLAKGYKPGPGGTSFSYDITAQYTNLQKRQTGFMPQLSNQVDYDEACGIYRANENKVFVQTKWDGERRGVLCYGTVITGANRKGQQVPLVQPVQNTIMELMKKTSMILDFDSEDMGDYLTIFDVLKHGRNDLRLRPFIDRLSYLLDIADILDEMGMPFLHVDRPVKPRSFVDFVELIETAKERNEEGVIIRLADTVYSPGKPASGGGVYKLKFKESATCRVDFIHPIKSSVGLEMDNGMGDWVNVGNTTIYPNSEFPHVGDIIEVEYLYAYPGGSLFQPVYKGIRHDVGAEAAVLSQLKYKKGT